MTSCSLTAFFFLFFFYRINDIVWRTIFYGLDLYFFSFIVHVLFSLSKISLQAHRLLLPRNFMVSSWIFRYVFHFELIFMHSVRGNAQSLCIQVKFNCLGIFVKHKLTNWQIDCICGPTFGYSILLHWSIYVYFFTDTKQFCFL